MKSVILLLCFVGVAVCQNCSDIGEGVEAMTGVDIQDACPSISTEQAQCCSRDFIEGRRTEAEEQFVEGLRDEITRRFTVVRQVLDMLREYLNTDFLDNYFNQFSTFGFNRERFYDGVDNAARGVAAEFRNRFLGDDDDTDDNDDDGEEESMDRSMPGDSTGEMTFLGDLLRESIVNATQRVQNENVRNCIQNNIENHYVEANEEVNAQGLENVELAMRAIQKIEELLDNITSRLAGFRPIPRCVGRLVELNTCGRCTAPRPPFCGNVCGALARACYSPFEDALDDQLEALWELVRDVINRVDDTLDKLEDFDLFDANPEDLVRDLAESCSPEFADILNMPTEQPAAAARRRRQATDPSTGQEAIPTGAGVTDDGEDMATDEEETPTGEGVTDDDSEDTATDGEDSVNSEDDDDTDSDGVGKRLRLPAMIRSLASTLRRGPFGYPGRVLPGLCGRLRRAVRRRNCWGGDEELDDDITEFTDDGIEGQDQNPVIQIPIDELQAAAAALETPVTDLTQDPEFQAALPQTLDVPGSASGLVISVAGLSLSLLLAIFMF